MIKPFITKGLVVFKSLIQTPATTGLTAKE